MKRILPILLVLLLLAGCRIDTEIRPDTIVDIPLEPTETATEAVTEMTEATEPDTEAVTDAPTESPTEVPTEKPTSAPTKNSSNKTSTRKPSSGKEKPTKATEATKSTEAPTAAPTEPPTEPPTELPTTVPTQAPTIPVPASYSPTKLDKAIIAAINAQRTEAGLAELDTGRKLSNAAAQRARELDISWSHVRPDGSDFSTVLAEFGVKDSDPKELLYYTADSIDANEVVSKWTNSNETGKILLTKDAASIAAASHTVDGVTYIAVLIIG